MEKTDAEYKQAILIGAAPMGKEAEQLLGLLKWAGYENEVPKETAGICPECGKPITQVSGRKPKRFCSP